MLTVAKNSVGIDYHQESVQVCILNETGDVVLNDSYPSDASKVRRVIMEHGGAGAVALEACSGSATFLKELVQGQPWIGKLGHPGYVSRMRQNPDKSDHSDGLLLADLLRVGYLPEVWIAPDAIRDLRVLVRYRSRLVKEVSGTKLRIRALLREWRIEPPPKCNLWTLKGCAWIASAAHKLLPLSAWVLLEQLEQLSAQKRRVKAVEHRIEDALATDPVAQRLRSLKGVGLVLSATLRAEIGDFTRFKSGKQLARFCGVTPRNASSGKRVADAGIIKAGNPALKAAITECAHLLCRYDPELREFKDRLVSAGKPKCVAIAAVANRWTRRLYYRMTAP